MNPWCFFNGEFIREKSIFVHISDLSILRGYGAFDYFPVVKQQPFRLKDYLSRFFHSAKTLCLTIPHTQAEVAYIIRQIIEKNNVQEAAVKLLITGGYSNNSYTIGKPNFAVLLQEPVYAKGSFYEQGATLLLHEHQRELPYVKSINYISSIRLEQQMQRQNAVDVLYHYGGNILEASRANFFLIKGNILITAKDNILQGITRKTILEIAAENFQLSVRNVQTHEIAQAHEAFITGSGKRLMPIVKVGEQIINKGSVGAKTKYLMQEFEETMN